MVLLGWKLEKLFHGINVINEFCVSLFCYSSVITDSSTEHLRHAVIIKFSSLWYLAFDHIKKHNFIHLKIFVMKDNLSRYKDRTYFIWKFINIT